MRTPALRDLQGAFWRALAEEPEPALVGVVTPGGRLSPTERLGIYAGMYLSRLVDALAEDFPQLARLLGANGFADLVREYLARHPSRDPSIRQVGRALPEFLAGRQPAYLQDVARLEWTRLEVFDAPDVTPLGLETLRRVPPAEWPALRFALVLACVRLVTGWSVHGLWSDPPLPVVPARTALRVWRDGFLVYQTAMDDREEAALERVIAGESFAAVCEAVGDSADAAALVLRWIEDGILAAGDPTPVPLA